MNKMKRTSREAEVKKILRQPEARAFEIGHRKGMADALKKKPPTKKKPDARTGAERIADERIRQLDAKGFSEKHDDEHDQDDLAWAAVCYAAPERVFRFRQSKTNDLEPETISFEDPFPWLSEDDKRKKRSTRKQRIRILEKAGALIAAEIDRLLRLQQRAKGA